MKTLLEGKILLTSLAFFDTDDVSMNFNGTITDSPPCDTSYTVRLSSTVNLHKDRPGLFPNPFDRTKTLDIDQSLAYKLFSLTGRVVSTGQADVTTELLFNDVVPGVYFLNIRTIDQKQYVYKVIKI